MTKEEAREKFKLADRLFNESQFAPALKVLTELNAAFPNERNVLYPMARCLTGLGRNAEALDLTDRIARQFDYAPALELYKRLKAMKSKDGTGLMDSSSGFSLPPGVPTLDSDPIELPSALDSLIDRPPISAAPPPLPSSGAAWKPVALWVGLALGAFVAMLAVQATVGQPVAEWQARLAESGNASGDAEEVLGEIPYGPVAMVFAMGVISSYFIAIFPGYWALRIMEALPFNDFGEDMKDVALYTLWGLLLFPLIGIGWLIFLIIMRRHYELSAGKQFIVVVLWFAFSIGISIVTQIITSLVAGSAAA